MESLMHDLSWVLPLRSDGATMVFQAFTALGYFPFYLAALPLGYWLWDRSMFTRLAVLILASALLNGFLKDLFDDPRPAVAFALDGRVGDSYGLPSGHAQIATVTWFWLARELRSFRFGVFAAVMVGGICFSRLYLGVHDVEDVLAGFGLGVASLLLFEWLLSERFRSWRELDGRIQLGALLAVQLVLWLLWPEPDGAGGVLSAGGLLTGWWAGVLVARRFDFARHPDWRLALTAALLGLGVLFAGLMRLHEPLLALGLGAAGANWLQTACMGLFVTAIGPWLYGLFSERCLGMPGSGRAER